jgi:hypothetical protein
MSSLSTKKLPIIGIPGTGPAPTNWQAESQGLSGPTGTPETAATGAPGGRKKKRAARRAERRAAVGTGQVPTPQTPFPPQGQGVGRTSAPAGGGNQPVSGGQTNYPSTTGPGPNFNAVVSPFNDTSQPFIQTMVSNPQFLYGEYLGANPADFASQFYGSMYDPQAIGTALGRNVSSNEAIVNFGAQLAQQLTGQAGMGRGLDPQYLIAQLFNQASQAYSGNGVGPLAAMASMDPGTALSTFLDVLRGAVGSIMPEDSFNALLATINRYASDYIMQWGHRPPEEEKRSGGNIISYIQQHLGANFGLF